MKDVKIDKRDTRDWVMKMCEDVLYKRGYCSPGL